MTGKFDTDVIICKWKKQPPGYRLWVKGRPGIFGEGEDLDTAKEALTKAIWHAADDLDSVEAPIFVFDPPLPKSAATERFLKPKLVVVRGDGGFRIGLGDIEESMSQEAFKDWLRGHINGLYSGGFCRTCLSGIGTRTQVPIQIGNYWPGYDGGPLSIGFHAYGNAYSDQFLALLRPEERERLSFLPVQLAAKRDRRSYFELVSAPDVAFVGVKGLDVEGRECTSCGRMSFWYREEPTVDLMWFICRSDLPDPLPTCFVVADNEERQICFSQERWDQIQGKRGTKGMVPAPLGVVSEEECDRRPRLPTGSLGCDCRFDWPDPTQSDGTKRKCWHFPFDPSDAKAPDLKNLQWFKPAVEAGTVQIMRQTLPFEDMEAIIRTGKRPKQLHFISFRCKKCWRLGWIIAKPRELSLVWW